MTDNPFFNITRKKAFNRRTFLKAGLQAALLGVPAVHAASLIKVPTAKVAKTSFWQTMRLVHNQLFPKDDKTPGADDINATAYLQQVIHHKVLDEKEEKFIHDGIGWLQEMAQKQFQAGFEALSQKQQLSIIEQISRSRVGENWLSQLMTYLIEALLADPVYGANTNQAGWLWLGHQPGYPSPKAGNRWYELVDEKGAEHGK